MNAQQLIDLAKEEFDYELKRAHARMLEDHHSDQADERLRCALALIHLASAIGMGLTFNRALGRLAEADYVFELASDRLLEPVRRLKQHVFTTEFKRLEQAFFGDEAKARHAVFIGHLMDGGGHLDGFFGCPVCNKRVPEHDVEHRDGRHYHSVEDCHAELLSYIRAAGGDLTVGGLGYQASMLLVAAEDAGLDADGYRAKLVNWTGAAINRLYPVHDEPDVRVIDPEAPPSRHPGLLAAARDQERQARELAAGRIPDLAVRIDRLRDRRLKSDVRRLLNQIRKELAKRRDEGWMADPVAYEEKVILPAAEAARRAA